MSRRPGEIRAKISIVSLFLVKHYSSKYPLHFCYRAFLMPLLILSVRLAAAAVSTRLKQPVPNNTSSIPSSRD